MHLLTAFLSGLLFGCGLLLAGMSNPAKVLAFLDLAGRWDPSLLFLMGGAVLVGFFAFRAAGRLPASLLGGPLPTPAATEIDARLVAGALVFGLGWGLVGYCPGPALVALTIGGSKPVLFVAAMVAGMGLRELLRRTSSS